jgi:PIN domain nuclease of toxin-antitoxin system
VLDASAVLTFLAEEPGWEYVDERFEDVLISAVNFGEVLYKVAEEGSDPQGTAVDLVSYGLRVIPLTAEHAARLPALREVDRAARLAASGSRPGQTAAHPGSRPSRRPGRRTLSLADLCCLALAWESSTPVVTGDRHWLTLDLPFPVVDYRDPPAR